MKVTVVESFTSDLTLGQPKKKQAQEESRMQKQCIRWFDYAYPKLRQLLFAIPNGGKRGVVTATIMKAEGVRKGIPDLFLAVPRLHWHGLFIEMKTPEGKIRPEQKEFIEAAGINYKCIVCRSFVQFEKEVKEYLS
jgi:hypothetical protein